ncbi:UNVERIFIED_CONTAM: LIVCS family branched-chain amino acid:cation transporter [Brevibacillus sp. OAP136]
MKALSNKEILSIGLMLFALFFGAGNMIFPPSMGLAAGTSYTSAIIGFIVTGVGLPLLSVAAIAFSGGNLQTIASRVHPIFGLVFTVVIYLAIGPFFGIPRTGSVAFEMGMAPFLSQAEGASNLSLLLYTVIYFSVTYWLCLNPSKLVDRIGNLLTPLLLLIIAIISIRSLVAPIGDFAAPSVAYQKAPFIKGFIEGYLTMDTIGALVFGIVVLQAVKERGITDRRQLVKTTLSAGVIAGAALALVYVALGYLGATSQSIAHDAQNGGQILTMVVNHLFGSFGNVLLGLAITLACLTTSVGLITASGQYFASLFPSFSYRKLIGILTLFSTVVANLGLSQIIALSVPVLIGIYPLAIVLIILSFFHRYFRGYRAVYVGALIGTAIVSLVDAFVQLGVPLDVITAFYNRLPLYPEGIGWIAPALVGALLGYLIGNMRKPQPRVQQQPRIDKV